VIEINGTLWQSETFLELVFIFGLHLGEQDNQIGFNIGDFEVAHNRSYARKDVHDTISYWSGNVLARISV
jgi:hypothetical protein